MKFEVNSDTGFVTVGYGAGSSPTFTRVFLGSGTTTAPSLAFTSDTDTGLFLYGANQMGFAANGDWSLIMAPGGTIYGRQGNNRLSMPAGGGVDLVAAGTNQNITLTPAGATDPGGLVISRTTTTSQTRATLNYTTAEVAMIVGSGFSGILASAGLPIIMYPGNAESFRFAPTGELFCGTTTNANNGKIQLANHTAITGGIGFGTDTSLYRTAANSLGIFTNSAHSFTFNQNGANSVLTFNTFPGIIVNCTRIQAQFGTDLFLGGFGGSNENTVLRVGGTGQVLLTSSTGPAISSAITGRGARQALLFDGTKGVAISTAVCTFGTRDFTIAFIARRDSAAIQQYLLGNDIGQCFYIGFRTSGALFSGQAGGSPNADFDLKNVVGKEQHIVLTRSGTTLTCYSNGVSVGTITDSNNYSAGAITLFAADAAGVAALQGSGSLEGVYNRALSATEVVALYEAAAPAQLDYGLATNDSSVTVYAGQQIINGANSTFASGTGWGLAAGNTISGGKLNMVNLAYAICNNTNLRKGRRYRVTITIDSITGGSLRVYDGVNYTGNIGNTAGTKTLDYTMAADSPVFLRTEGGSAVVDDITITPLGLLVAPDSKQAGGGLAWYDTSGNGRTITLPATNVSWNAVTGGQITLRDGTAAAPAMSFVSQADMGFYKISSAVLGLAVSGVVQLRFDPTGSIYGGGAGINNIVQLASTGAINLIAAGTNQNISLSPSGNGWVAVPNNNNLQLGLTFGQAVSNSSNYLNSGNGAGWVMHFTTGSAQYNSSNVRLTITDSNLWTPSSINLLLGTNTDSSNGRLQLATHTAATGGIGFGTEISLYRAASTQLTVTVSTIEVASFIRNGSGTSFQVNGGSLTQPTIHVNGDNNTGLFFELGDTFSVVTGGTRAISFDGSQNATFTGTAITAASATGKAGLRLPHGAAPTAPVNGDIWTTTAGLYVRINGATVGPLT